MSRSPSVAAVLPSAAAQPSSSERISGVRHHGDWLEAGQLVEDRLIDTFLAPGATVADVDDPQFAEFTTDHICDGAVASCRRDTGRLAVIFVTENVVDERVLLPGVDEGVVWGELPYEAEIDRSRQAAAVRRAAYDERLVGRDVP